VPRGIAALRHRGSRERPSVAVARALSSVVATTAPGGVEPYSCTLVTGCDRIAGGEGQRCPIRCHPGDGGHRSALSAAPRRATVATSGHGVWWGPGR
jgi:hypothetical protein